MSIGSQLPPLPPNQPSSALLALAQASGSTVEAKVVAQQPNGLTQVQIGRQTLTLQLPTLPMLGATLQLAVQQVEGQLQLSLLSNTPPAPPVPLGSPAPPPIAAPAATVQLSPAALAVPAVAASATNGAAPASAPVPATAPPSAPAVSLTATLTVPVPSAGAAAPVPAAQAPIPASQPSTPPNSATPASPPGITAPLSVSPPPAAAVIPYAVAPPAAQASRGSLPLPSSQPAPVPAAPIIATPPQSHPLPAAPPPVQPPPQPLSALTPQAALAQMVQRALPQQGSIAGLTAVLSALSGKVPLPQPVVRAAQAVLAQRLPIDAQTLDGPAIAKAVLQSGVFQEALLASGDAKTAGADLKTALLGLQRALGQWLGNQPPVPQASAMPPPVRGMALRARFAEPLPADLPQDSVEAGKLVLERTEAALSRLRLHQAASLPDTVQRQDAQWSLDLPVTIAGQHNILPMQIHRDPEQGGRDTEERGWQVRFAINLGVSGEVGAQITLRGRSTGVMIWADDAATAAALETGLGALRGELDALGLHAGSLIVRAGPPAANSAPASAGHFLDATR